MDEESDSTNWVLVDEIDCGDDALLTLNPLVSIPTDSDQESDGSISILSDHPTDSYSEEEHEIPVAIEDLNPTTSNTSASEADKQVLDDYEIQVPEIKSSGIGEENHHEDGSIVPDISHEASEGDVSSTSDSSSKVWAYVDDKSKLELNISKKQFYLDCSQEPILEVSLNETDEIDTESSSVSNQECQAIVRKQDGSISHISSRESGKDVIVFNRIGIGILLSIMVLVGSHLIQQYLDEYQEYEIHSPRESFLDGLADNEKARAVIEFCMGKQKSKGEYSEHAVEKCVLKKLRKKNKEEAIKKSELYLQLKERLLELREKQLVEKEKEMLRKWKKRSSISDNGETYKKKGSYGGEQRKYGEENIETPNEFDNKVRKRSDYKGKKRRIYQENYFKEEENPNRDENKHNLFPTKNHWNIEKTKEGFDKKHKKEYVDKKFKKFPKIKEETLKIAKEKAKMYLKQNQKNFKGDQKENQNEEWYIKYNPLKNTVELINITTLPEQDSLLIKNGNKTINGQWYFSLYGVSRTNIRNKEKVAEWYFKRGHFRENKRDKAKWYFDYMSARDDTRYLY